MRTTPAQPDAPSLFPRRPPECRWQHALLHPIAARIAVLLLVAVPVLANAQSAPDDTLSGPPPAPAAATPPPPDNADQPPAKPTYLPTPAPPPPTWEQRNTATISVLDKVDGRSATLQIPVGGHQTYRNITLDIRSCYARPATQPPDATAFLVIQDSSATTPSFSGWMLAAEPAASMMEHPVYDVRVLACR